MQSWQLAALLGGTHLACALLVLAWIRFESWRTNGQDTHSAQGSAA